MSADNLPEEARLPGRPATVAHASAGGDGRVRDQSRAPELAKLAGAPVTAVPRSQVNFTTPRSAAHRSRVGFAGERMSDGQSRAST
jgi:hypothetical protein